MILDKEVEIKMNGKHISYYRNLGYTCNVGDTILIDINDVPKNSSVRINAVCSVCNSVTNTNYLSYRKSFEKGYYTCSQKCSIGKVKKTNLERYGVDAPAKSNYILQKMKDTTNERYGVDNIMFLETTKCKLKKTNLNKYGYESATKHPDTLSKMIKTNLERYGVDNCSKLDNIKEKKRKSFEKNYGVSSPFQINGVFDKSQLNNLKVPRKNYNENIYYQGTYELDFLQKYNDSLNIKNGPTIKYIFNEEKLNYFSDFYLPDYNLIVEIKSKYTYDIDYEKNKHKKEYSIKSGYNFIFIIDKNYYLFNTIINKKDTK
jgi:hypothetical protein